MAFQVRKSGTILNLHMLIAITAVVLAGAAGARDAAFASTITVTNSNNSGDGSLRAAIESAYPGDTIEFDLTLPAVITLEQQLEIDRELAIVGPGADQLTLDGNYLCRVFMITQQGEATIEGLTITKGNTDAHGGGVYNAGSLQMSDCRIYQNFSGISGDGAGMYNAESASALITCEKLWNCRSVAARQPAHLGSRSSRAAFPVGFRHSRRVPAFASPIGTLRKRNPTTRFARPDCDVSPDPLHSGNSSYRFKNYHPGLSPPPPLIIVTRPVKVKSAVLEPSV